MATESDPKESWTMHKIKLAITCSNLTMETLEQCVKYVQS